MSTAAAPKRVEKTDLSEVLSDAVRARTTPRAQQRVTAESNEFANIEENAFFKIVFNKALEPEQKKAEIAKALTFSGTKEENRARIKEFETFKEYLQHEREEMAQEIIKLTDTETFSELKQVYDQLNTSLLDFDDRMRPLTDIIDAIYKLRTNGLTLDAFKEIQDDKKFEEEYTKTKQEKGIERETLDDQIRSLRLQNARLGEQKGFFGLGGVTQAARVAMAENEQKIKEAEARKGSIDGEIKALEDQYGAQASKLGEFAAEKAKLRELLDISTDEHKDRQKALVDAALTFVNTAKDRVGSVRKHLGQMNGQVENLFDANSHMVRVYAVMNEAIKEAETNNQKLREEVLPPSDAAESMLAKDIREEKKMAIEQHMTTLDNSAADTMATYADLTSQTIRIKTMREANEAQVVKARQMHSQGIAGVADRLSVVLQAVSSAALGESSAMAKDTLSAMAANTNSVAQKEAIRIAMGVNDQNEELAKAIDDLGAYGEVIRTSTSITREGIGEMRARLEELQTVARGVQDDIQEAVAVSAEVGLGLKKSDQPTTTTSKSPFKFG